MSDEQKPISEILGRADETLRTAQHGYDDLVGNNRERRLTGLRNLITFGRSVTWVVQNIRSIRPDFDEWYGPKQDAMKADPLMKYFITARNELEKQGKLAVGTRVDIHSLNPARDMHKFGPPPTGAKGFFMGDQHGGSGWKVELPGGGTAKYYVEIPGEIGEVSQHFTNFPESNDPALRGKSLDELCALYLARLDQLLIDARQHFLGEPATGPRGSHLRVVK